jgi:hypothetical protein
MKNLIYLLLLSFAFIGCKKDSKKTITPTLPAYKGDLASFTINGNLFSSDNQYQVQVGNDPTNVKLDSINKQNAYFYSGVKDSLLFSKQYGFSNISVAFIKKYASKNLYDPKNILFVPENTLELFTTGKRNYATDFKRQNKQEGVAIEAYVNGSFLYSYSTLLLRYPSTIAANAQNNSTFEITNLQKLDDGNYMLEAKFNATLFDKDEKPTKIENGYIRMRVH